MGILQKEVLWIILVGYGVFIKFLLSDYVTEKTQKVLKVVIWTFFIILCGLTFYVNWYMPHGPKIDTGDVVCQNDDRGPCRESYIEDTRKLNIPEWAKFLRTSEAELLILGLLIAGFAVTKNNKNKE